MADERPIGLLDSGVGGLSVLREVRALLPTESLVYLADQAHLPYGEKDRAQVRRYVEGIARFLLEDHACKMIVIPCHTACAAALHHLRGLLPHVPIVGMEPAVKPAAERTKSGVIGVISTQATYQSELFASVVDRFAKQVQVEARACPDLVMLAEQGAPDTPETYHILRKNLAPLIATGMDHLVLGCTHFPFLSKQLQVVLGDGVTLVDPAPAVARQVQRVLTENDTLASVTNQGKVAYFTTGDSQRFGQVIETLLGESVQTCQAHWQGERLCPI